MKLNRTGSNWDRLERNKINENWDIIEGSYNDVVDKVSEEAFDKVVNSAKLNWKEPVDKYADLPSGASEGDTRMVRDSGKVYRFNGEVWQEIQQIDAGPVNELDARLTSQLAQKANQDDINIALDNKISKVPQHLLSKIKNKINYPDGWSWTDAPITIFRYADGTIFTDFDASEFEHIGNRKTYYVKLPAQGGNDSNDGLTPDTAKATLHSVLQMGDADIILIDDGYYNFNRGTDQKNIQKNVSIKALKGKNADVTISTNASLDFEKTNGFINVYHASRTFVASVYDGEELVDGDMTKLKEVESTSEVDSTAGSYYYDSPTLYIHPLNSRVPDDEIKVFLGIRNLRSEGGHITYVENIKWHGGSQGAAYISTSSSGQNPLFVAKNCEFKYSNEGNGGLTILGADAYLQNCVASSNHKDGFNYHIQNGRINKVIEVNCKGFRNGIGRGTQQDNGSTMHDGGKIIRVNGEYFKNEGPNVHDVNNGTESWNIGNESHESVASGETRNANYQIENGTMWLDACVGYGSIVAYGVPSGVLHLRNSLFDDGVKRVTEGVQNEY